MKFMVKTSTRHVHITREHLRVLFGKGYELTKRKDLPRSSQYVREERVTVVGGKREMPGMSILGSVRKDIQVELSLTDVRSIGVSAPVRGSGDVVDSGSYELAGPCGEVELIEGVIATKCHIYTTSGDAVELGAVDRDIVSTKIGTPERGLVFGNVVARVSPSCALAMHIDTDESNATDCGREVFGETVK